MAQPSDPRLMRAAEELRKGDYARASSLVAEAVRSGEDRRWSKEDLRAAASILLDALSEEHERRDESHDEGALDRSASLAEVAAQLAERGDDPGIAVRALITAGSDWFKAYRLEPARRVFMHARTLAASAGVRQWEAVSAWQLGNICLFLNDLPGAREAYEATLELFRATGERLGEAGALVDIGEFHLRSGDKANAREAYNAALASFRAIGDQNGEALTLRAIGDVHVRQGDLDTAREHYDHGLAIYRSLGDRAGEARILQSVGQLRSLISDFVGAREAYDAALSIFRAIHNRFGEATVLRFAGDLCLLMEDLTGAREAYDSALSFFSQIGDRLDEAGIYTRLGRLTDEEMYFKRAIEIHSDLHSPYDVAIDKLIFGLSRQKLGDHDASAKLLREARDEFARFGLAEMVEAAEDALAKQ